MKVTSVVGIETNWSVAQFLSVKLTMLCPDFVSDSCISCTIIHAGIEKQCPKVDHCFLSTCTKLNTVFHLNKLWWKRPFPQLVTNLIATVRKLRGNKTRKRTLNDDLRRITKDILNSFCKNQCDKVCCKCFCFKVH